MNCKAVSNPNVLAYSKIHAHLPIVIFDRHFSCLSITTCHLSVFIRPSSSVILPSVFRQSSFKDCHSKGSHHRHASRVYISTRSGVQLPNVCALRPTFVVMFLPQYQSRGLPCQTFPWVAVADLAKGDSLGAYQALLLNGQDFLSRTRVDTRPGSAKQRVVHNYCRINDYAKKHACRYENVKDLPQLLRLGDYMLSLDVSGAFWHILLHPSTAHYLSFHFALPEFVRLGDGTQTAVPLQPRAYWVDLPSSATGERPRRYQVIERSCLSIPFGYTNSPFIWTKVMKVIGRCLRRHRFVRSCSSTMHFARCPPRRTLCGTATS